MTTMANTTPSVSVNAESATETTSATSLPLVFDAALLRGRETELIEASWDGEAMLSLPGMLKFGERDKLVIGTHPGCFHQDELVAIALFVILLDVNPDALTVIRSRNPEDLEDCDFVVDVLEGQLDHHGSRNDKVSAAASRVYRLLYNTDQVREQANPLFWTRLSAFVDGVCRQDNGIALNDRLGYVHTLSKLETVTGEPQFDNALKMVISDLHAMVICWMAEANATAEAQAVLDEHPQDAVLVFNKDCRACDVKHLMWEKGHPALYYISPESDTDWRILCAAPPKEMPDEVYSPFKSRFLLPEQWRGKRGEELSGISKVPGAIFCHAAGFIGGWQSMSAALDAAQKAIRILKGEEDA